MLDLIRLECKKVFWPVLLTMVVLTLLMWVLTAKLYQNYTLHYDLEAWEVGTGAFSLLFPLCVVLPLCWELYYERQHNFLLYVMPRVPLKKYLTAKWIAYTFGAFCLIAVPYIIAAVYAVYLKAPVIPPETSTFAHVFQTAFVERPLRYVVLLSCWRGVLGVLVMTLGYVLAMYSQNIFVILTGPFIYTILENFILSILGMERYRLVVAFDPTCISYGAVSLFSFLVGPVLLLLVTSLTAFFLAKVKKNTVVNL